MGADSHVYSDARCYHKPVLEKYAAVQIHIYDGSGDVRAVCIYQTWRSDNKVQYQSGAQWKEDRS